MSMQSNERAGTRTNLPRATVLLVTVALAVALFASCAGGADRVTEQPAVPVNASRASASPSIVPRRATPVVSVRSTVPPARIVASPVLRTPATPNALLPCRSSDLEPGIGPPVSEPSGQHTISLTLTNRSPHTCSLSGYPRVTLLAAGGRSLPFDYRHQGDQVVTAAAPHAFALTSGALAYLTLNKYRCDLGDEALARSLRIELPGEETWLSLSLPATSGAFGFCGANDPGSIVSVSPLEATFKATLRP